MASTFKKSISKKGTVKKLIAAHDQLVHSENMKVASHVQRECNDWILNTMMLEKVDIAFKYKRKKNLQKFNRTKG